MSLNLAFMGTPDFTTAILQSIINSRHNITCVYTQPPRPKGRGGKLQKSPIHLVAEEHSIEVRTPVNFKNEKDIKAFKDLNLDAAIVAGYGILLPEDILNAPKYGCINIHPSILPRWRGTSPVQYAIWKGDKQTGVSIMKLIKKMDAGPIIDCQKIEIPENATYENLNKTLWNIGAKMITETLDRLDKEKTLKTAEQSTEGVTYTKMLNKNDGRINWSQTATEIDRQVRALNPWPGTWCKTQDNKRIKILETAPQNETPTGSIDKTKRVGEVTKTGHVTCGKNSSLKLIKIQPENKKPMDIKSALNGGHIKTGQILE